MKPHAAGGGDLTRLLAQRALAVMGSLRLPFALLFLFAAATVLSCRTAVRRRSSPPLLEMALPTPPPSWNATWLRLAAGEVPPLEGEAEIEDLLERHRTSPLLRRFNRVDAAGRRTVSRLRMSEDPRVALEVRRALREWVRYRRYQPDVMGDLVKLIKLPIEQQQGGTATVRPYASCAVVGNSGILLQHEFGELIDSHELVIRLNNARINGFHRNVGTKTGLSFVNSNILHLCNRRPGCYCHPYGEKVPLVMYICQAIHFLDYNICSAFHKTPLLITDARFDLLCSRIVKYYSLKRFVEETGKTPQEWNKTHDTKMFHYSSGMQAVMLAVGICDKVSIFGFGKAQDAKHHYHTNQKKELDLHDYEAEYLLYRDLIEKSEAIPFLADSNFIVPPVVMYQ